MNRLSISTKPTYSAISPKTVWCAMNLAVTGLFAGRHQEDRKAA
jgi:hypothetical protein